MIVYIGEHTVALVTDKLLKLLSLRGGQENAGKILLTVTKGRNGISSTLWDLVLIHFNHLVLSLNWYFLFDPTLSLYLPLLFNHSFHSFFEHIYNDYFEVFVKFNIWLLPKVLSVSYSFSSAWVIRSCFFACLVTFCWKMVGFDNML